jgi:hypothetical protein
LVKDEILNVHIAKGFRWTEMQTTEELIPEQGSFDIEKLERCKSPAESIQTEVIDCIL